MPLWLSLVTLDYLVLVEPQDQRVRGQAVGLVSRVYLVTLAPLVTRGGLVSRVYLVTLAPLVTRGGLVVVSVDTRVVVSVDTLAGRDTVD